MSSEQLRDEEETLRKQIRELTPEQRKEYFRLEGEQIKDPDTYAVLNWFVNRTFGLVGLQNMCIRIENNANVNCSPKSIVVNCRFELFVFRKVWEQLFSDFCCLQTG